jgi:hypothetical protein
VVAGERILLGSAPLPFALIAALIQAMITDPAGLSSNRRMARD